MESFIAAVILVLIVGAAVLYIVKAKKNGAKCIGCPHSKTCSSYNHCRGNGAKPF